MNKCSMVLRGEPGDFVSPTRTIVVTGSSRGGTSMVALVLRGLGVWMGEGMSDNHEDLHFYSLLHAHDLSRRSLSPLVAARNSYFATWGLKSPLLLENNALPQVLPLLRNPIVVLVLRNPLASAQSRVRRDNAEPLEALLRWERLFTHIRDLLAHPAVPILAVDYEACVSRPGGCVRELAHHLGLACERPDDLAANLIDANGGGYRRLPTDGWTAAFMDDQRSQIGGVALVPQSGKSVSVGEGTVRYVGNVFFGEDHLVELRPPDVSGFGTDVRLRLCYPEARHADLTGCGHNMYFTFSDRFSPGSSHRFSLGQSMFVSRADDGRTLRIAGTTTVAALALGIANDEEFGMVKDLPKFTLLPAG